MANWYAIYDDTSKEVEGAGFFADPTAVTSGLDTGKSLSTAQAGDIPNDLIDMETQAKNYTYDDTNNVLVHV